MIRQWCRQAMAQLTMILSLDSAVREFSPHERGVLHDAHGILSRHQDARVAEIDI